MRLRRRQSALVMLASSAGVVFKATGSLIVDNNTRTRVRPWGDGKSSTSRGNHHDTVVTRRLALDHGFLAAFCWGFVLPTATFTFDPAVALTPEQAATQYDAYAPTYDRLDGGQASTTLGIEEARAALLRQATGNVLEIGVGTGLNLNKYDAAQVKLLTLVDISDGMLQEAADRVATLPNLRGLPIKLVRADATKELVDQFGIEAFDTVVDSFSLCVMGNQGARDCLDQVSRVVKPGGKVLLLENARSSNRLLGLYQDATADAAAVTGGKGCVYNQDVGAMIRETGRLTIMEETAFLAGLFRGYICTRTS